MEEILVKQTAQDLIAGAKRKEYLVWKGKGAKDTSWELEEDLKPFSQRTRQLPEDVDRVS